MATELTRAQMKRLDLMDPTTKVIGFHVPTEGPLLILRDGSWRSVDPDGRIRILVPAEKREKGGQKDG